MPKWNVQNTGPQWLMDSEGRVYGYKDRRGREYGIPQNPGVTGDAEGFSDPPSSVSVDGNQPSATLAATVGTPGQTVRLSDGENKGAILMWAIPADASVYTWCWWLWPQSPYEA